MTIFWLSKNQETSKQYFEVKQDSRYLLNSFLLRNTQDTKSVKKDKYYSRIKMIDISGNHKLNSFKKENPKFN